MAHPSLAKVQQQSVGFQPIEDYAVIGDLHTVALVGKHGSIDWCCLPRFDSPSVFGALLDARRGGFFRIAPSHPMEVRSKQCYLPETNILLTRFFSVDALGEITDFMPIKPAGSAVCDHHLVRAVTMVHGSLSFEVICRPAFNYARDTHTLSLSAKGAIFQSATLDLGLASSVPLEPDGLGGVRATFTLHTGQSALFLLESAEAGTREPACPPQCDYQESFERTRRYWRDWLSQCQYQGRWRDMVQRSALVLKLLTYAPTGALVAAPTTSLPETIGGARNWDYRYTWLRDSALTLSSLLTLGLSQEAEAFIGWLDRCCQTLDEQGAFQPVYAIDGERALPESILDHLEGYRMSRPVRIGNGAARQYQLDVFGELLEAILLSDRFRPISSEVWHTLCRQLTWLEQHWQEDDEGIWEVRGGPKPFVHSRLMSWVAFDRALRLARRRGLRAPVERWKHIRARISREILNQGWSENKHSFVQYYGGDAIDASALLMIPTGFVSPMNPRMLRTIERVQQELESSALVRRYHPQTAANDGLQSSEGAFTSCSFWLAEALAYTERVEEACLLLEKMFTYANHVGLYAEEIGPGGEALGNFPQAFTHLSLIMACARVNQVLNHQQRSNTRSAFP